MVVFLWGNGGIGWGEIGVYLFIYRVCFVDVKSCFGVCDGGGLLQCEVVVMVCGR